MSTQKEVIREQFDHRRNEWKIVKKTYNGSGGWKRYGGEWYGSRDEAEKVVRRLVRQFPEYYEEG